MERQSSAGKGVFDANGHCDQHGQKRSRKSMSWLVVARSVEAATSLHERSASET